MSDRIAFRDGGGLSGIEDDRARTEGRKGRVWNGVSRNASEMADCGTSTKGSQGMKGATCILGSSDEDDGVDGTDDFNRRGDTGGVGKNCSFIWTAFRKTRAAPNGLLIASSSSDSSAGGSGSGYQFSVNQFR